MHINRFFTSPLILRAISLFLVGLSLFAALSTRSVAWQGNTIAVVSAASFDANCASESIAAAFGAQLSNSTLSADDVDPVTPGIQLPTTLGGTTVEVAGRAAGIFFVSPGQVNFLLPSNLPAGNQTAVIRNNGTPHNGTVTIAQNAPGIFTFNANGQGVIAGNALRVRNSVATFEDLAQSTSAGFITRAIDLGPATDLVYVVIYGTGWRQAGTAATRVLLGGEIITPLFVGAQGGLAGLDQINALIPRSLLGRGRLSIVVAINSTPLSNTGEVEIAGITTTSSPLVNSFAPDTAQAGQAVTINGSGFIANTTGNTVRIGNIEAQVVSASASQIIALVPYGSDTSKILVRTVNGDGLSNNALRIRTSMSGVVESTNQQPLTNVTVRSLTDGLRLLTTTTALNGTFVLSEFTNPQNGTAFVTIDGGTVLTTPKFGTLTINQNYLSGRDTQFGGALTLQQVNGTSGQVGGGALNGESNGAPLRLTQPVYVPDLSEFAAPNTTIKAGDVTFDLPNDSAALFPDGSTRGEITLTVIERALLPVRFPAGLWSSAVVQITPFGTTFSKGGRLRFPNPERYPAGSKLFVCQFDQGLRSATLGQWIAPASAVVSSDGQFVETDADAIKQGAYYFLVGGRPLTSVVGRVVESDRSPARRARVRIRGQEALTDGNGSFILRNVPVSGPNDILIVEATVVRPDGRIDYANSNRTAANPNSITSVGLISLPDPSLNQAPVLLIASSLTTPAAKPTDYEFFAYDYDDRSVPRLSVTGASFATIIPGGTNPTNGQTTPSLLRLAPTANQLGNFTLAVTATDRFGATVTRTVNVTVIR